MVVNGLAGHGSSTRGVPPDETEVVSACRIPLVKAIASSSRKSTGTWTGTAVGIEFALLVPACLALFLVVPEDLLCCFSLSLCSSFSCDPSHSQLSLYWVCKREERIMQFVLCHHAAT